MKYRTLNRIILFLIVCIVAGAESDSQGVAGEVSATPPAVWVVDNMQRIKPDAPAGKDSHIELFAARGEYEPFQIIIKARQGGLNDISVLKSDLVGPDGCRISKANIALYREHYIYLPRGSKSGGWFAANRPLGRGWYPEPLIPFTDPQTGMELAGAKLDAIPFDLAENTNQPIWVDLFVPRQTKAGQYKGTYLVTSRQGKTKVNLTLNVWNFEIPRKPSLTAIGIMRNADAMSDYTEVLKHKFNPYHIRSKAEERELIDRFGLKTLNLGYWTGNDYGNCNPMPEPPSCCITSF